MKKTIWVWAAAPALLFFPAPLYAISEAHSGGERCAICHYSHHGKEDRTVMPEAIREGKVPCYLCHTPGSKSGAPETEKEFVMSQSHHPIRDDKECLVCHEIDERHDDGRLDEWPHLSLKDPDPEDSHVYTGAKINDFCLSCHDNSPVTLGSPPRTPIDLSSAYEFTGHGRIDINLPCSDCHEHHASASKPHLLKDVINNAPVTGNDNSVCFACHLDAKDRYPGKPAYESSEHGLRQKLCVDCHNPHGDNKDLCYLCHNDKYSSHYSQKRDKLCVDCHNPHEKSGLKMTREDEEKLCYLCHRELEQEFGNIRDGRSGSFTHHKVDDEEYGGGKVECFDCHNPHTVTKMSIVSDPDPSGFGPGALVFPKDAYQMKTDAYDNFCLKCHDGSRSFARNIASELASASDVGSGFTSDRQSNLHKVHKEKGFGCQNCHDAHSSPGTGGIKRGALLQEELTVNHWNESEKYVDGKNSCSASGKGLGCH